MFLINTSDIDIKMAIIISTGGVATLVIVVGSVLGVLSIIHAEVSVTQGKTVMHMIGTFHMMKYVMSQITFYFKN